MNDVPVAHQNRDRPRRAARRESNPTASAKKTAWLYELCCHFFYGQDDSKGSGNE